MLLFALSSACVWGPQQRPCRPRPADQSSAADASENPKTPAKRSGHPAPRRGDRSRLRPCLRRRTALRLRLLPRPGLCLCQALQFPEEFPDLLLQSSTSVGTAPEGPCQLATGPAGALYANVWHQSALRIVPSFQTLDIASSTGACHRRGGQPLRQRQDPRKRLQLRWSLAAGDRIRPPHDSYSLAVSGKEVFVADAATNEVKVFEPSVDPVNPKRTIEGPSGSKPFVSLTDAALAIDPTNGHLLVLDNLQPGFEHPHGAIDEFDEEGNFLGQLKRPGRSTPSFGIGGRSRNGMLFVASGNSEGSNAYAWSAEAEGGGSEALGAGGGGGAPLRRGRRCGDSSAERQQRPAAKALRSRRLQLRGSPEGQPAGRPGCKPLPEEAPRKTPTPRSTSPYRPTSPQPMARSRRN